MDLRKTLRNVSLEKAVLAGLILLGLLLRVRQYLLGRSLWLDEAMLALNLVTRDYAGLLKPLAYKQGAPLAFLFTEKLVINLLGNHEATLRLVPLLAGCAALLLFALVLRQALGRPGTLLALALFALGVPLIYYASEVKQYSTDVFFALLLLWQAGGIVLPETQPGPQLKHKHVALAITGALALWFSHPALFVLAGVGATLLLHYAVQKDTRRLKQMAVMSLVWLASFAILYFVSLRGLASNQFLHDYWADSFMPQPPWANPGWFLETLVNAVDSPIGLGTFWLLPALLMLAGLIQLLRQKWQFGALFGLTLAASLAASELGLYPFSGRMILFSVPIFLALTGAGLEAVMAWLRQAGRWTGRLPGSWLGNAGGLLLAAVLLFQPVTLAYQNFVQPNYGEHIRPTMAFLEANYRPGDKIYVYYWALPAFQYYAADYGFTRDEFIAGHNRDNNPKGLFNEIYKLRGSNVRVWILFSHVYEKGDVNVMNAVLAQLDQVGNKKRTYIEPGTSVYLYLYDLSRY